MTRFGLLLVGALLVTGPSASAIATEQKAQATRPPTPTAQQCARDPSLPGCVKGTGSGKAGTVVVGVSGDDSGDAPSSGGGTRPVQLSENVTRNDYVLSCSGNTRSNGGDVNCMAATTICDQLGPGYLAFWKYEATFVRATGAIVPPGWQFTDTVCLPPGSPLLDPRAAIPGIVERDFKSLVVLKGVAISQPGGSTLVNYKTGFYTDARRYTLPPVDVLGYTVVITAEPAQYDWYFGDGDTMIDGGPGAKDTLDVNHTYTRTGQRAPYVVITWTGTFTVDGGAARPVIGTATTTGAGTPLQVKQARAELVTR